MSGAYSQLDAEIEWLRGKKPGSLLGPRGNQPQSADLRTIAERIEDVLRSSELASFLRYLEKRNIARLEKRNAARSERLRSPGEAPYLLGPQLFHIFHAVEARQQALTEWPALGRPPAALRAHFRKASNKAKTLACLLRKAPQPTVTLAAPDSVAEAAGLFQVFPTHHSLPSSQATMPLDQLLDEAATSLDLKARTIGRASRHKQPASSPGAPRQKELRSLAASFLVQTFRKHLGTPRLNEVALITSLVSDIETDAEYVKAIERQRRGVVRG